MPKPIQTLFKGSLLLLAVAITLFIGYLSLKRIDYVPIRLSHLDKIYHVVAYFLLASAWLLCFSKTTQNPKTTYFIALACIIYGMVIEVLQGILTTYRTASVLDVFANMAGVIAALMLFKQVYKKIRAI